MKVFVILQAHWSEFVYSADNVLDSIWSSEELALKRLYFLENYFKKKLGENYENRTFDYEVQEVELDTLPSFSLYHYGNEEIDKHWAEQK